MQLLGPPEKVALYKTTSVHRTAHECAGMLHTGYCKPRKTFQAFRSRPATVLVGTRRHLIPTSLYSCKMIKPVLTPGFVRRCGARGRAYKLYPAVETNTSVPAGTGNSLYTFPETPTTGFVRGRTSSFVATRWISIAAGWSLRASCTDWGINPPLSSSLAPYRLIANKPFPPLPSTAWNRSLSR